MSVRVLAALVLLLANPTGQPSQPDLSGFVIAPDVLGDNWTIASQGSDDTLFQSAGFNPAATAGYSIQYQQVSDEAVVGLYQYADRSAALASLQDPGYYWGRGNTTIQPLTGYGDGPAYRAYPPGRGENSGITFVDGNIVTYVRVDGFATADEADALCNLLASAEDTLLQAGLPADD